LNFKFFIFLRNCSSTKYEYLKNMNKLNDRTCCTQLVYLMDKTRCCCESLNDGEFFPSFVKSDPGIVNAVSCGDCEYGFKC
jgi:hypothetical protein